ncbi:TPA: hypothetical protein L5W85_003753 [Pseudomonas aeruginosa]|uniref:hypothetical protein n=1 Tax=Pseudomonas aeruginosa TaxID=287 RepID=UPI000987298F|nr:hypothetical protein [Pseudomonas aeruginosa]ASD13733.1 hypothetical protein CD800_33625 [Pseudomonas aeruginosa]EIU6918149.1 hypothetical protein [Pseudomonas aeruginosa]EIZ7653174.1 hypothetical protein [Pseudomonas aeruginosa]EKI0104637.1 hypothetical protein [Pseudomonas aeruginosa]EKT8187496.1 hypothetical protein [Pseudomonas aeruginosa]
MNSITIVLRSGMGMQIDSVRPYLRNGMPIAIGRAGAVISHFADGDAHLALRTIAEFPCPEQDNLPAANMRQIALAALSGAGASSEPGNPGGEPVSGPGNAGERPHPAPGSGDSKLAESLQTLVRWLDRVDIEDGYVGVPVIEAVEVAVNELRRLRQFERICEGLPQDAIDGGWTVQGIRGYAKRLEDQLKAAQAEVEALRAELQSQRERNTELIFKLGSATNGWGRCEKERDAALARAAELEGKLAELEKPVPTHGEHSELRRIAVALKNPLLSGEEASDLMVRYEALTMPDHIIALIDRQAQHSVPEEFIGRLSEFLAQRGATGKALLRELRAMLAAEPTSSASPSCKWTESSGIWETGCGQTWGFVEDGPAENGALFCHHCGGRLVLIKSDDQEDDGEPCPDCMENAPAPGCEA